MKEGHIPLQLAAPSLRIAGAIPFVVEDDVCGGHVERDIRARHLEQHLVVAGIDNAVTMIGYSVRHSARPVVIDIPIDAVSSREDVPAGEEQAAAAGAAARGGQPHHAIEARPRHYGRRDDEGADDRHDPAFELLHAQRPRPPSLGRPPVLTLSEDGLRIEQAAPPVPEHGSGPFVSEGTARFADPAPADRPRRSPLIHPVSEPDRTRVQK